MQQSARSIIVTARWVRRFAFMLIGLTAAVTVLAWVPLSPSWLPHIRLSGSHDFGGLAVNLTHNILILLALVYLVRLLRHIEAGALFSAGVTGNLRQFALLMLLAVATSVVVTPALALLWPDCADASSCVRRFPVDMSGLWMILING